MNNNPLIDLILDTTSSREVSLIFEQKYPLHLNISLEHRPSGLRVEGAMPIDHLTTKYIADNVIFYLDQMKQKILEELPHMRVENNGPGTEDFGDEKCNLDMEEEKPPIMGTTFPVDPEPINPNDHENTK